MNADDLRETLDALARRWEARAERLRYTRPYRPGEGGYDAGRADALEEAADTLKMLATPPAPLRENACPACGGSDLNCPACGGTGYDETPR